MQFVKKHFYLIILFVATASLRLINLGYSDYIQDEISTFFYWGGLKNTHLTPFEFLLNEQKGPLQVILGYIPYSIFGSYDIAWAQRLPFSLFGIATVLVLYYAIYKLTKNDFVAFAASFLFSVNGLILGYARIAQYQNLLFFFTFAALYFFANLENENIPKKTLLLKSFVGSAMFAIAFYAHWYAVFILIPIAYIGIKYFVNSQHSKKFKFLLIISNIILVLMIVLPYYVPYFENLLANERNTNYAESILGRGLPFSERTDLKQFLLYNPFLTFYLYIALGALGVFITRKNPIFTLWFVGTWIFFRFFVAYSGLHFYNMFIPVIILCGFGLGNLKESRFFSEREKLFNTLVFVVFGFLYVQSFMLFVDHKKEYPMQQERIVLFETKKYTHKDELRHKTGFPHKRYWNEINQFLNEQNSKSKYTYSYYTNEDKGIARIYMDLEVGTGDHVFLIGIKNPYSFATDRKFPQFKNKVTLHEIENDRGESVVKIYRFDKINQEL